MLKNGSVLGQNVLGISFTMISRKGLFPIPYLYTYLAVLVGSDCYELRLREHELFTTADPKQLERVDGQR